MHSVSAAADDIYAAVAAAVQVLVALAHLTVARCGVVPLLLLVLLLLWWA